MEEQYFFTRMLIMQIGAVLVLLLLAGYGVCSLADRIRRKRKRKQLEKSLRKNGSGRSSQG